MQTSVTPIETDALVIGAGPVGLFQVFQLGLLGMSAQVVDALPEPGGQCVALYPDKPIYDVPGIPACSGRELALRLLEQAAPFLPQQADGRWATLHLNQRVARLLPTADGRFELHTDHGQGFLARAVFVAAGAGAFVPRTLNIPGLSEAPNVHHHEVSPDATPDATPPWAGQHLVVHGGGEEAVGTVLNLLADTPERRPARITLLHRRDVFQVDPELDTALREQLAKGTVQLAVGLPDGAAFHQDTPAHGLRHVQLLGADGQRHELTLDHLLIRLGLSPKLGPLSEWGLTLERKQVAVSTASFESNIPQVYAVGDINTYPGKKRLLLCGFHEATLAAHAAHAALHPDAPQHLLYTTTSPLLKARLGRG